MIQRFSILAVIAAACLAAAVPLSANDVPVAQIGAALAADEAEIVDVFFEPPLDRPLRYRVERVVTKDGVARSFWSHDEFVFSQREQGYRMTVRTLDSGVENADPDAERFYRQLALEIRPPFVLLLDQSGAITEIENAEAYWAAMTRAARQAIAASASAGAAARDSAIGFVEGMMADTPPEGRLALLTQTIAPITGYADVSLTLGEDVTTEMEVTGLMGLTVNQHYRIRADRVENGLLFLSEHMTVPREELIRAVEELVARVPVTGQGRNNAADRAQDLAALRNGQIFREYEAHYEVEVDTGLTRRYRSTDRTGTVANDETHSRVTTITLERID